MVTTCDRCVRQVATDQVVPTLFDPDFRVMDLEFELPVGWGQLGVSGLLVDVCPGCMVAAETVDLRRDESEL